jgi:hypothetical protein
MTHKQAPRTSFLFPDVGEAALYRLAGNKTGAGCVIDWLHCLQAHDDDERSIGADEFNLSLELRKIDNPRAHECIQYRASSDNNLVIRGIQDELSGPQSFESGNIAFQSREPLFVIERAHSLFVRRPILCHRYTPL